MKSKKMKINRLKIHNFKIFDDVDIDFREYDANIFCGKNGFGKTSVFDALELLFTGQIKRYAEWVKSCHNAQLHFGSGKPLVHDETIDDVYICAEVSLSDGEYEITRREMTRNIDNPLKFEEIFNTMSFLKCDEKGQKNKVEKAPQKLKSFSVAYAILNYQSQEQATDFLKSKEDERTSAIEVLFQTLEYDDVITRLSNARKTLDSIIKNASNKIKDIDKDIESITKRVQNSQDHEGGKEYQRLFVKCEFEWDKATPNISISDIEAMIEKEGELDRLEYYLLYTEEYRQYRMNTFVDKCIDNKVPHTVAFLQRGRVLEKLLGQYDLFKCQYMDVDPLLSIDTIKEISFSSLGQFEEYVNADVINDLKKRRDAIISTLNSNDKLQNAYNRILQGRDVMNSSIAVLNGSDCPLCGHHYRSNDELIENIDNFGQTLKEHAKETKDVVYAMFNDFKKIFNERIILPLHKYFIEKGITSEFYKQYQLGKSQKNDIYVKFVAEKTNGNVDTTKSVNEIEKDISFILQNWKKEIDRDLNINWLQSIHAKYARYMDENITANKIESKRLYLIDICNRQCASYLRSKNLEKNKQKKICSKAEAKSRGIYKLIDNTKKQRSEYIEKVISDIEILFYIYSGRIMQDSFYGRGIFMKMLTSAKNKQRIMFVSGSYDSEIDVLYNMSSGQLVSVAIAFLLSLNKLYDKNKYLAIDDPIQTIDDINFWGLIETIRHEFRDRNIFVSTHEDNYASLLRYKLDNMNIPAIAYDMKNINENKK